MPSTACVIANTAFPPKSNFKVEDIPDLNGRVAIVRGAFLLSYLVVSVNRLDSFRR